MPLDTLWLHILHRCALCLELPPTPWTSSQRTWNLTCFHVHSNCHVFECFFVFYVLIVLFSPSYVLSHLRHLNLDLVDGLIDWCAWTSREICRQLRQFQRRNVGNRPWLDSDPPLMCPSLWCVLETNPRGCRGDGHIGTKNVNLKT